MRVVRQMYHHMSSGLFVRLEKTRRRANRSGYEILEHCRPTNMDVNRRGLWSIHSTECIDSFYGKKRADCCVRLQIA